MKNVVAFHGSHQSDYASRFVRKHDWWVSTTGKWEDRQYVGQTVYCSIDGGNDGSPIGEAVGLPQYEAFKDAQEPFRPLEPEQAFARKFINFTLSQFPSLPLATAGDLAMLQVRKFKRVCYKKYPYEECPGMDVLEDYRKLEGKFLAMSPSKSMVTARVAAWLRHKRTEYDHLIKQGIRREEARRQVQPVVDEELQNLSQPA